MNIQNDIKSLKADVESMSRTAQGLFLTALKVLETRDRELGETVILQDAELDRQELKIDKKCMQLLALKEPYGVDFRYIFSVIKTIRDLERIGDESKSIVKWHRKLQGDLDPVILELGAMVRDMLDTAMRALIEINVDLAESVLAREPGVDSIQKKFVENTQSVPMAFISKSMERVADMTTNIAENIIFSVRAEDIRHGGHERI